MKECYTDKKYGAGSSYRSENFEVIFDGLLVRLSASLVPIDINNIALLGIYLIISKGVLLLLRCGQEGLRPHVCSHYKFKSRSLKKEPLLYSLSSQNCYFVKTHNFQK